MAKDDQVYQNNLKGLCLKQLLYENRLSVCNLLHQNHLVPTDLKTDSSIMTGIAPGSTGQQRLQTGNSLGPKNPQDLFLFSINTEINHSPSLHPHHLYFLALAGSNSAKFISLGHVYGWHMLHSHETQKASLALGCKTFFLCPLQLRSQEQQIH